MVEIINKSLEIGDLTQDHELDKLWFDTQSLRRWSKAQYLRLYFRRGILAENDEYISVGSRHDWRLSCTASSVDTKCIVSLEDECRYNITSYGGDKMAVYQIETIDIDNYQQTSPPHGPRDPRERRGQ